MPHGVIDPHLAKLVSVYEDVREIVLHSFQVDFEKLDATFNARFDGEECPDSFQVQPSNDGGYIVCPPTMPWHHTDIVDLVRMPAVVEAAISRALQSLFPAFKPIGRDRETGQDIPWNTPMQQRLRHPEQFDAFMKALSDPEFTLAVRPEPDPPMSPTSPRKAGPKRHRASRK